MPLDALAFALPFTDGTTAFTVMYNRIQFVAGRSGREQAILAHVLAHEIGHVLQRTDRHVGTGVMKAYWNGHDHDAMEKKPLEFTKWRPTNFSLSFSSATWPRGSMRPCMRVSIRVASTLRSQSRTDLEPLGQVNPCRNSISLERRCQIRLAEVTPQFAHSHAGEWRVNLLLFSGQTQRASRCNSTPTC